MPTTIFQAPAKFAYFDRAGHEITKDDWRKLLRDRQYTSVADHLSPPYRVVTTWVGLGFMARPEDLFLTMVQGRSRNGKEEYWIVLREVWSDTEAQAHEVHAAMVAGVRQGKGLVPCG